MKMHISEAEAERKVDIIVQWQLRIDPVYRYAENAEQQAEREDQITRDAWANVADHYLIDF